MSDLVLKGTSKQIEKMKVTIRRPTAHAGVVRRVRVVLLTSEGVSGREIAERLDLTQEAVCRISRALRRRRVEDLAE